MDLKTSLLSAIVNLVPALTPVARVIAIGTLVSAVAVPAVVIVVSSVTPVAVRLLLLLPATYFGLPLNFLPLTLFPKLFRTSLSRTVAFYLLSLDRTLLSGAALVLPCAFDLPLLLLAALLRLPVLDLLSLASAVLFCTVRVLTLDVPALLGAVLFRAVRVLTLDVPALFGAVLFRAIRVLTLDVPALLGAVLFRALLILALFRLLALAVLSAAILLPESDVDRSYE
ncbi:MAG TPA: hypothetical protein VMM38_14075 [Aridibacter sp.]|nr:hypothetical protein [Aridibacter sp.]